MLSGFQPSKDNMIELKDRFFITKTNEIYINAKDYLGKTIKYEGIFKIYEAPGVDKNLYYVIRYGPGCCAIDATAGFEVKWDNEYPNEDDWVEVIGILEEYNDNGRNYLRLALISLRVLPTRGAEIVLQ